MYKVKMVVLKSLRYRSQVSIKEDFKPSLFCSQTIQRIWNSKMDKAVLFGIYSRIGPLPMDLSDITFNTVSYVKE
jgi:hypothetical protein